MLVLRRLLLFLTLLRHILPPTLAGAPHTPPLSSCLLCTTPDRTTPHTHTHCLSAGQPFCCASKRGAPQALYEHACCCRGQAPRPAGAAHTDLPNDPPCYAGWIHLATRCNILCIPSFFLRCLVCCVAGATSSAIGGPAARRPHASKPSAARTRKRRRMPVLARRSALVATTFRILQTTSFISSSLLDRMLRAQVR